MRRRPLGAHRARRADERLDERRGRLLLQRRRREVELGHVAVVLEQAGQQPHCALADGALPQAEDRLALDELKGVAAQEAELGGARRLSERVGELLVEAGHAGDAAHVERRE